MSNVSEILKCNFCSKTDRDAKHMIKGPEANICSHCVRLCLDILTEDEQDQGSKE